MSLMQCDARFVHTQGLFQGNLGEVRLPTVRSRGVIRLIETKSPADRVEEAAARLGCFREREKRLWGYRLLREARAHYRARRVGTVELYNLTGHDEVLAREAVAKVGARFRLKGLVLLVINEATSLADASGENLMKPPRSKRFWNQAWRHRRTDLGCIFVPGDFGEDEQLFCDSSVMREVDRLRGRGALIYHLVIQVFLSLARWDNSRWMRGRLAKWKIDLTAAPEVKAVHLINKMMEP
jgi:hypothetical protein